jgi:AraC family transcriptional regulator, regulatory protein of adaptative response / methylphosphotriester-DNA alkyltransferase methyltransferase
MAHKDATISEREAIYGDALAYLHEHYASACSVDDVAAAVPTSRRQLQRVMETVGGASFRKTLASIRMEKAAELLASDPDATVQEVARAVGYAQPAQFATSFTRVYGISPSQYRSLPPDERPAGQPVAGREPVASNGPAVGDWFATPFAIAIEQGAGEAVVKLAGELDIATVGSVRQALEALRDRDVRLLTIDLSQLEFIDSTGLQVLLELDAEQRADGFQMRIRRGTRAVQHIFAIAGVADSLPFVD